MWNQSPLHDDLDDLCYFANQPIAETYHLLGDSAYPLSNHLMVPFKTRGSAELTDVQKKFNTHLASRRAVIERAFGLLGIRFPRITHLKFRSNKKRILCVVATCVLHNWCLLEDDQDESLFEHLGMELETDVDDTSAEQELGVRCANVGGSTKRDIICNIIRNLN